MLAGILIGVAIGLAYRLLVIRCRRARAVQVVAPARHYKPRVHPPISHGKGKGKGKGKRPGNGSAGSSSSTGVPPPPTAFQRERQRDFERMMAAGVFAAGGTPATASSTELVVVTGESPVLDITSMWYLAVGTSLSLSPALCSGIAF